MIETSFQPDWLSPPGDTIRDLLHAKAISKSDLAARLQCSIAELERLLAGDESIALRTARILETTLGGSAAFWVTRDAQFQSDRKRLSPASHDDGTRWLSQLPLGDMVKFGWVQSGSTPAEKVSSCLGFFNVRDPSAWLETYRRVIPAVSFKTSGAFESTFASTSVWLRQGERVAAEIRTLPWNREAFAAKLPEMRRLTRVKEPALFLAALEEMCAECGVALVVLRTPKGCHASGATRFLSPAKALLLLSFRHLSDDHFWFAFFHEAGHLLLHGKQSVFIEDEDIEESRAERQANDFAARLLIPDDWRMHFDALPLNKFDIVRFAKKIGVSPGIVVGQLEHLGRVNQRQFAGLKRRYKWG